LIVCQIISITFGKHKPFNQLTKMKNQPFFVKNLKTIIQACTFSLFTILMSFCSCSPPVDYNCYDPIKEWPFPNTGSRWLFQPIVPGTTFKFKVYHRKDRNSPYVYRRDESFFIKDTMIKKIEEANIHTQQNCNQWMTSDYLVADITGPESMTCELSNGGLTTLIIDWRGKELKVADIQYQAHQVAWNDSITIGDQTFYDVKDFEGGTPGTGQYIDSTYIFYNLQYGILKYIVNDTLIYVRNIH